MDRLAGLQLNLSPSADEVAELLSSAARDRRPISVDVETPEDHSDRIVLCGLADSPRRALVFEWGETNTQAVQAVRRFL